MIIEIFKFIIVFAIVAFLVYQFYKLVIDIRAKIKSKNKKNDNVCVPYKIDKDENIKK